MLYLIFLLFCISILFLIALIGEKKEVKLLIISLDQMNLELNQAQDTLKEERKIKRELYLHKKEVYTPMGEFKYSEEVLLSTIKEGSCCSGVNHAQGCCVKTIYLKKKFIV